MTNRRTVLLCLASLAGGALAAHALAPVPPPAVVHVVLFDLPSDAPVADAQALSDDARRLLPDIPGVEAVWAGPKALDDRDVHVKDYDVALCVRLRSVEDLRAYAGDPRHQELVGKWKGKATWRVIDFFDRKP